MDPENKVIESDNDTVINEILKRSETNSSNINANTDLNNLEDNNINNEIVNNNDHYDKIEDKSKIHSNSNSINNTVQQQLRNHILHKQQIKQSQNDINHLQQHQHHQHQQHQQQHEQQNQNHHLNQLNIDLNNQNHYNQDKDKQNNNLLENDNKVDNKDIILNTEEKLESEIKVDKTEDIDDDKDNNNNADNNDNNKPNAPDLFSMAQTARLSNPELMKYDSVTIVTGLRKLISIIPSLPSDHELKKNPKSINASTLIQVIENGEVNKLSNEAYNNNSNNVIPNNINNNNVLNIQNKSIMDITKNPIKQNLHSPINNRVINSPSTTFASSSPTRTNTGPYSTGIDMALELGYGSQITNSISRENMIQRQILNEINMKKRKIEMNFETEYRFDTRKLIKPDLSRINDINDLFDRLFVYSSFPLYTEQERSDLPNTIPTSITQDESIETNIIKEHSRLHFLNTKDEYRADLDDYTNHENEESREQMLVLRRTLSVANNALESLQCSGLGQYLSNIDPHN